MSWLQNLQYLIGRPVGVSLMNGQGISGILVMLMAEKSM